MRYAQRGYLLLLNGMALLAAIMLVWLMVAVVLSVVIRNLGLQPSAWFFLSTEYAMFYLTLLGAPWLVRQKGHVHIELLTSVLPLPVLNILSRAVALVCVLVSGVLAWKGLDLFLLNIERSDYDVRAFFVPKWILTIVFPVSFTLMAVEFGRFVIGPEILHSGEAGIKE
ncbi:MULTISPECIES: TRAP transporter small permease [unclassified Halomonas]|uniref:TRAP transporter small permease n=1 Tax=unclassified Halomonas TaxID=2609666 RepID=UPI0021E3B301|nr:MULTISPECIES: TRAP transporter small permease [unclassified Halomonas]UYF99285.1 TRAP transporter small permease [Halomonas sp. GD1P12]WNL39559.1 TRAP transporter small permease [Halomonas sp. PAMB 3232]WNL42916.1 TRAP transporter small permease [Halomonas sp. PAMB 3264]